MTKSTRFIPSPNVPEADVPWPKFARTPSEALQCVSELRSGMQKIRALYQAGDPAICSDPVSIVVSTNDDWRDWNTFIDSAPVLFWPQQTAELVRSASQSYPLRDDAAVAMEKIGVGPPPSYLPRSLTGLCVFEAPTLYMSIHGVDRPLSAIGWIVAVSTKHRELWVSLRGIQWTSRGLAMVTWFGDGGGLEEQDSRVDASMGQERQNFIRWICTAAMFIEQEILVSSRALISRGERKRCEHAKVEPTCHVITLRKELSDDVTRENGSVHSVEWTHRWVVRGHWRRQFFPKRSAHVPMWIHPHVKGPSDKPFIEPKPVVFNVAR